MPIAYMDNVFPQIRYWLDG